MTEELFLTSGLNRGKSPKTFLEFLNKLEEARKDGWELPEKVSMKDFPRFLNEFCIVLHKSEAAPEPVVVEDRAEVIKSGILASDKMAKDDLVWYANEVGFKIPEDVKAPLAIRKKLKEFILNKDSAIAGE